MAKPKAPPVISSSGTEAARQREARLAAALRTNLARRKTQAREREADAPTPDDEKPE